MKENREFARQGGEVARSARENLESKLGRNVISSQNNLGYKYKDEMKEIETK